MLKKADPQMFSFWLNGTFGKKRVWFDKSELDAILQK